MKRSLTKTERRFCCHYALLGNVAEAACSAGYPTEKAMAALLRPEIQEEIGRGEEMLRRTMPDALCGLRRLAFGGIGDALALLLHAEEGPACRPEELDLFCISEIKRPKGGGLEIKFHDRLKALEVLLLHQSGRESTGAAELYSALERSARQTAGAMESAISNADVDSDAGAGEAHGL